MKGYAVYSLCEPGTGEVRYVGYSKDVRRRFRSHCKQAGDDHKSRWVQKLRREGLLPHLVIKCFVQDSTEAKRVEIALIAAYRSRAFPLTNGTAGGDGLSNPSAAVREKLSKVARKRSAAARARFTHRGHPHSKETREKLRIAATNPSRATRDRMSASAKARPPASAETRAKIGAAHKGRPHPPHSAETRAKIGAASKGRIQSPETIAKRAAALRDPSAITRAKLSDAMKRRWTDPKYRAKINGSKKGRRHTVEAREKMRAAALADWARRKAILNDRGVS